MAIPRELQSSAFLFRTELRWDKFDRVYHKASGRDACRDSHSGQSAVRTFPNIEPRPACAVASKSVSASRVAPPTNAEDRDKEKRHPSRDHNSEQQPLIVKHSGGSCAQNHHHRNGTKPEQETAFLVSCIVAKLSYNPSSKLIPMQIHKAKLASRESDGQRRIGRVTGHL